MEITDIKSSVTAPVNISHHLLGPRVLVADVEHVAAIVVTVAGQRPNYVETPMEMGDRSNFL